MPLDSGATFKIDDRKLLKLLESAPRIANQNMNRAFQQIGSQFMKKFSRTRLVRGIYRVRRKGNVSRAGRGQPSIPKKAKLAGFKAEITGRQSLDLKRLSIRTHNPALLLRETGGIVRPRRAKYLVIRGDPKGRGAAARRERYRSRQIARFGSIRHQKQVLRRVSMVAIAARLGFASSWNGFRPQARKLLAAGIQAFLRRLSKQSAGRRAA